MTLKPPSAQRRALDVASPLALFTLLSILYFAVPLLGHEHPQVISADDRDASALMWMFAWWPHALGHGLDPFLTHSVFVPVGYNLAWATSMPGPSLLLAPLTLTLGPAATWNTLAILAPALSAWTAFLLCRQFTHRIGPALVGGYVFGFSPFVIGHIAGAPSVAFVALLPLAALLIVRHVRSQIRSGIFILAMSAVLVGQFSISTETFATATLMMAFALATAYALLPDHRVALRRLIGPLAAAFAVTAVVVSPYLYAFLFLPHAPVTQAKFNWSVDPMWWVVPSRNMAVTVGQAGAGAFPRSNALAYISIPVVALVSLFAVRYRNRRPARLLVVCLLTSAVICLGPELILAGHFTGIPLPWRVLQHMPLLHYAFPVRFGVFVILPAAVMVSLYLTWSRGRAGWVLAALAVIAILPDVGNGLWRTDLRTPEFMSSQTFRSYLRPQDRVLTVPVAGANLRWQADEGFPFRIAGGYLGGFPKSYTKYPTFRTLLSGTLTPSYGPELRRFIAAKGVTAIVVDAAEPGPWRELFASLRIPPTAVGGVLLYRLTAPPRHEAVR